MNRLKRTFVAGAVLIGLTVAGFTGLSATADATPTLPTLPAVCADGTVLVSGNTATITQDPDSGDKGNWATDAFTRTTDVKVLSCAAHTYQVIVRDKGTFTTLPDGPSPRQGLPLSITPFTGTFTGNTTYTVTSLTPPYSPTIAPIAGSPHTGDWWTRFFHTSDLLRGSEDASFSWTYATACEKWVDSNTDRDGAAKSAGDITGKVCPPTTTPSTPTTTVTAPPTTVTNTVTNNTVTTTTAQVVVPHGAPQTGGGATAGIQDEWLLALGAGLALAGAAAGGTTVFRRRRAYTRS